MDASKFLKLQGLVNEGCSDMIIKVDGGMEYSLSYLLDLYANTKVCEYIKSHPVIDNRDMAFIKEYIEFKDLDSVRDFMKYEGMKVEIDNGEKYQLLQGEWILC